MPVAACTSKMPIRTPHNAARAIPVVDEEAPASARRPLDRSELHAPDEIAGIPGEEPSAAPAAGLLAGAAAGAAVGTMAGPVGTVAGAVIGAVVGAAAGAIASENEEAKARDDADLDETIGVTSGNLGEAGPARVPPQRGAISGASAGIGSMGGTASVPSGGPIPKEE